MSILIFPHIQRESSVCCWNSNCSERFSVHSCHFCYHFHLTLKEINSAVNFTPGVMLSCDNLSVSSNTGKSPWETDSAVWTESSQYSLCCQRITSQLWFLSRPFWGLKILFQAALNASGSGKELLSQMHLVLLSAALHCQIVRNSLCSSTLDSAMWTQGEDMYLGRMWLSTIQSLQFCRHEKIFHH